MKSISRLLGIVLIMVAMGCAGPSAPGLPDRASSVTGKPQSVLPPTDPPGTDLLATLRNKAHSGSPNQYWIELDNALQSLSALEGAHFDPETGRLTLFGTPASEPGPLRLEDLVTTLRAEFQQVESLGVTIDPVPENPTGPWMIVKFFGGAENTRFGQVMFESDRLLKTLGLGKHNETHEPVTSQVEGFYPLPALNLGIDSPGSAIWSRFWISPSLDQFADNDSRGKPIVSVSDDKNSIWFKHIQLFVLTEVMTNPNDGGRLVSSGGQQDKASAYFANLLTAKYDEFAAEYPVLADLKELSKLLILADWIRQRGVPIDFEMLYLDHRESGTKTPEQTPTLSVETSTQSGNQIRTIKLFGGVTMRSRPFYTTDSEGPAKDLAAMVEAQPREALDQASHLIPVPSGAAKQIANLQQYPRPPPTVQSQTHHSQRRRALRVVESTGSTSLSVRSPQVPPSDTTLQGFDLPLFQDPATGNQIPNLPILRVGYNRKQYHTATVEVANQTYQQRSPDYIYMTSPLGDIHLRFENQPKFDPQRGEFFFAAIAPDMARYFPETHSVEFANGDVFEFASETGLLSRLRGIDKPTLDLSYQNYHDGPLVLRERMLLPELARPPPDPPKPTRQSVVFRESHGEVEPTLYEPKPIQLDLTEFSKLYMEIQNHSLGKKLQLRYQNGQLVFFESDLNKPSG